MRKVIIFNILALFAASAAFAANNSGSNGIDFTTPLTGKSLYGCQAGATITVTNNVPGSGTELIGKNSTGVGTGWNTSAIGYAINTQHISGSKAFGTSYDSSAMYQISVGAGTATAQPATTDSGSFPSASGWTSM